MRARILTSKLSHNETHRFPDSLFKDLGDRLTLFSGQRRHYLQSAQGVLELTEATRSEDHRAHVRVGGCPGKCELAGCAADVLGNRKERVDLGEVACVGEKVLQPLDLCPAAVLGDTVLVLAGQQAWVSRRGARSLPAC